MKTHKHGHKFLSVRQKCLQLTTCKRRTRIISDSPRKRNRKEVFAFI